MRIKSFASTVEKQGLNITFFPLGVFCGIHTEQFQRLCHKISRGRHVFFETTEVYKQVYKNW